MHDVTLEEVVRCSKRIVTAASTFQLGGEQKLLTQCHHKSTGPPLKTFLFERDEKADAHALHHEYCERVVQAIQFILKDFPGLNLHDRVAILAPDDEFIATLAPMLTEAIRTRLRGNARREFVFMSAQDAA